MTETDATAQTEASPTKPSSLAALRSPAMRSILLAEGFSSLGAQMSFVALPWFVLFTTGSATRMGFVFAIQLLPVALLGIPSAVVVQRLGIRRTMFACDLARAPLLAAVPVLQFTGLLNFAALLVIVFVYGIFNAPYLSAQRLLIPETFGDDETMVVQGNGLLEGVVRLATLVGPASAGVLIGSIGAVNVLYVNAATHVLAYVVLYAGLPRRAAVRSVSAVGAGPLAPAEGRGVLAGARFVLAQPLLRRVTLAALVFGFVFPPLLACLPVLTNERYDGNPRIAGLLFAAWGAGAVIGAVGVARLATRISPVRMGAFAGLGVALPLWPVAVPMDAWQLALLLAVCGVFTPIVNAPVITLIMLRAPEEVRAKVITFIMTANLLAGPLGFALAGPALDRLGIAAVLLIIAAGVSVAAALMLTLVGVDRAQDQGIRTATSANP